MRKERIINANDACKKEGHSVKLVSCMGSITFKGNCGRLFVPAPIAKWFRENRIHKVIFITHSELHGSVVLRPISDDDLEVEYAKINFERVSSQMGTEQAEVVS